MSVNKFIGIGNLTRDPEIRHMSSGEAFANCSIACNEQWKNKSGEKQESVEFINLVFFRGLAEIVEKYLKKGAMIYVEGKMKTEKYVDKTGAEKYTTKIIVNEMQMLGGKPRGEYAESGAPVPKPRVVAAKSSFDDLEDLPF